MDTTSKFIHHILVCFTLLALPFHPNHNGGARFTLFKCRLQSTITAVVVRYQFQPLRRSFEVNVILDYDIIAFPSIVIEQLLKVELTLELGSFGESNDKNQLL